MRPHDTAPPRQPHSPGEERVFWGHDYGTHGEATPERPRFEKQVPIDDVLHRVRSWLRGILP